MIRNLTPHKIRIVRHDGDTIRMLPSEGIARAAAETSHVGEIERPGERPDWPELETLGPVPVTETSYGAPEELPDLRPGVWLIVSLLTVRAAQQHGRLVCDLLMPSGLVRDDAGNIVGCTSLDTAAAGHSFMGCPHCDEVRGVL